MKIHLHIKRFFTSLLLLAVSAFSWATVEIDGIYYELITKAKAAEVKSKPSKYTGNIVIPSTITYGGETYYVTSIGERAFYNCTRLTSITISESVTSIGSEAFWNCSSLTKAEFASIEHLCKISFGGDGDTNPLYYAHHLYIDGHEVNDVVIPNGVTSIGNSTFSGCSNLTSFIIPNSVTTIGNYAFSGCSGLTSITIPEGVTSINERAFSGCSGLTSITIPNSVTSISSSAFGCSGLNSINVASGNTKYDSRNNCNAIIESVTNTLVLGCKNTVIPSSVTSIGQYAFSGCSSLTSISIPKSVTSIGRSAFYQCSGLSSITIPESVTQIGSLAFSGCEELANVYCYAEKVPSMGGYVFENSYVKYATLHVPESAVDVYKAAAQWKDFGTIVGFDPTGVKELKSDIVPDANENASIYDLNGRRLTDKPKSGYYIQGGKKYRVN